MTGIGRALKVCYTCIGREALRKCHGPCPCPVDGADIVAHAKAYQCPAGRFPARGLGDTVARVISVVAGWFRRKPKPCGGCARRRAVLNAAVPYPTKD